MSNINFKGFKGRVEKDSFSGYFTWSVTNKEGDKLADYEGGYSSNITEHKRFIKEQILDFLKNPIAYANSMHGQKLVKNISIHKLGKSDPFKQAGF